MMTSAFGEGGSSSMGLLTPETTLSQDSSDPADSTGLAKAREAASLLEEAYPQSDDQQVAPSGQVIGERWPGGEESLSGPGGRVGESRAVSISWIGQTRGAEGNGGRIQESQTDGQSHVDPLSMPLLGEGSVDGSNGGFGGGGSAGEVARVDEHDDLPMVTKSDRREWSLTTMKPPHYYSRHSNAAATTPRAARGVATGGVASGAGWGDNLVPPRWVPDEESSACSGCDKAFDWARRRHHCRACGRLYCSTCSRFRALLPRSFGTRDPQRVCQPCNARVAPLQEMLVESVSNSVKENDVEHAGMASYLNRPIAFTLGAEVRKAAYTIHNFTKEGLIQDRSIPQELLSRAKGLAFLTVIKGGFIVAGRVGTGLVVTRTEEGFWSAPSAIATFGMGYGALIGGEITDFVLVLNTDSAVEAFSGRGQVSIGAELSVAVGPLGRTGAGNVSVAAEGVAHAYSYSHSRGLFAGLSLEGGMIMSRPDVNRKFYGREVSVRELLSGRIAPPPAARPLYEALEHRGPAADQQRLLSQGFRVG